MPDHTTPPTTAINTALDTLRAAMRDAPATLIINNDGRALLRMSINGDIALDGTNALEAITAVAAIQRLR